MQSQTGELASQQGTLEVQKNGLTSLALYEEFSRSDMAETIRTRISNYERATWRRRRQLEKEAEAEVEDFRRWLEETKKLKPTAAHYCAVSLKSLLLGAPIGVQIAQIFNIPLNNLIHNQTNKIL